MKNAFFWLGAVSCMPFSLIAGCMEATPPGEDVEWPSDVITMTFQASNERNDPLVVFLNVTSGNGEKPLTKEMILEGGKQWSDKITISNNTTYSVNTEWKWDGQTDILSRNESYEQAFIYTFNASQCEPKSHIKFNFHGGLDRSVLGKNLWLRGNHETCPPKEDTT